MKSESKINKKTIISKLANSADFNDKYFWPREMKILNQLIRKYGEEFINWSRPPFGLKIPSLAYYLTKNGKTYFSHLLFEYKKETIDLTPENQEIKLSEAKIGEDILIQKKPKTLKDFLNLYK